MTEPNTSYRLRPNPGSRAYLAGVVGYYMGEVADDGLDLRQARRYLVRRLLEGGYVDDEDEGSNYARHFVVPPGTVKRDLERARRLVARSKG